MKKHVLISLFVILALGWQTTEVQAQEQGLPLGSPLPQQELTVQDVNGQDMTIGSLTGEKGTVFIFWSNQCAWVDKYEDRVLALHKEFSPKGIRIILVNANDAEAFPQEAASVGKEKNYPMTYIIDGQSTFARALYASRTPHVFGFDADKTLVYAGTIDDSPGDPAEVKKTYLWDASNALSAGAAMEVAETKAFGCKIKLKGGE